MAPLTKGLMESWQRVLIKSDMLSLSFPHVFVSTYISIIGARDEGTEIEGSGNAGEADSSNDARQ